ncbi:hypothetical protein [Leifsonia aquatica]|uniref:hypothetical protein n=1 Tax=Leifsonia aquatica TaxID=144185 RepID=UPI00381DDDE9
MGESTSSDLVRNRTQDLAKRIKLLVDTHEAETEEPLSYKTIAADLAKKGVSLSQGRWFYMLAGDGPLTTDEGLLSAIAEYFDVPASFLTEWASVEIPERIDTARALVKSLRRRKITAMATRTLGPLSPEGLDLINQLLDAQMPEESAN